MIDKKFTSMSIRKKLWLFLICALSLASGSIIISGMDQRAQEIEGEKSDAMLMVQSLAAQQEQIATATKQMSNTLSFCLKSSGWMQMPAMIFFVNCSAGILSTR